MVDRAPDEASELPAGDFSAWLTRFQGALRGEHGSDVPCDGCTACCRGSQFVLVERDEHDTRAHIPSELLFPAPGGPDGHLVIGYDEHGRCPMLGESGCSIYEHRPRACRTYDCRIFAAVGVVPREPEKALIADRARRWRFAYSEGGDRRLHEAVRETGQMVQEAAGPTVSATEVALRAIEIHTEVTGDDLA